MVRCTTWATLAGLVIAALALGCSSNHPGNDGGTDANPDGDSEEARETLCNNFLDDDGDGLVDCLDDDCAGDPGCAADGDGDIDSDVVADADLDADHDQDSDVDGDTEDADPDLDTPSDAEAEDADPDRDLDSDMDADADADSDTDTDIVIPGCDFPVVPGPACSVDCSYSAPYSRCERGDCGAGGTVLDCCVAEDYTCCSQVTLGTMYTNLPISYRGFWDDEHQCDLRRMVSIGYELLVYSVRTRGMACEYGFFVSTLRARISELRVGETYSLCDDPRLPNMRLVVSLNEGGADQINFYNLECEAPGTFTVTELGDATGEGYQFRLEGRLSELGDSGHATGTTLDVVISSQGLVEVEED